MESRVDVNSIASSSDEKFIHAPVEDNAKTPSNSNAIPDEHAPGSLMGSPDLAPRRGESILFHSHFFLHGLAMLLPWNILLTSVGLFKAIFKSSPYEATIETYMMGVFTLIKLLAGCLLLVKQPKVWQKERAKAKWPASLAYIILIIGTVLITVVFATHHLFGATGFFATILVFCSIAALTSSTIQTDLYSVCAKIPHTFIQQMILGEASSGLIASIFQAVLNIAMAQQFKDLPPLERSASIFNVLNDTVIISFAVTGIVILCSFIAYFMMDRLPYFKRMIQPTQAKSVPCEHDVKSSRSSAEISKESAPFLSNTKGEDACPSDSTLKKSQDPETTLLHSEGGRMPWYVVPWALKWHLIGITVGFFVTLSIISGVLVRVESTCNGIAANGAEDPGTPLEPGCWYAPFFVYLSLIFFNVGDVIGRMLVPKFVLDKFIRWPPMLAVYAVARLIFHYVHSLIFTNVRISDFVPLAQPLLGDWGFWFSSLLLGLCGGHLSALCLTTFSTVLTNMHNVAIESRKNQGNDCQGRKSLLANCKIGELLGTAGKVMTLAIFVGLAAGSWFGLVVKTALSAGS